MKVLIRSVHSFLFRNRDILGNFNRPFKCESFAIHHILWLQIKFFHDFETRAHWARLLGSKKANMSIARWSKPGFCTSVSMTTTKYWMAIAFTFHSSIGTNQMSSDFWVRKYEIWDGRKTRQNVTSSVRLWNCKQAWRIFKTWIFARYSTSR